MFERYVSIHGCHLNTYSYSRGGGMRGGYYKKTVKRCEDHVLIRIETAEWYSQDPTVTEYRTDMAVLDELEEVVRRHKMNFWNRKKFTHMFVHDGENESYCFDFDDADIMFSSQIYPISYRKKLAELDKVVEKYIKTVKKLSGPADPDANAEETHGEQNNG